MLGPRHIVIACGLLLACLAHAGCAESVDTRLGIDHPFSVYGMINPKADTHAVRVFEIHSDITLVRPEPIDAVVTTTLLQTGVKQTWRDSVIQLADGDYRHVFWAPFTARAGETYRLEVSRSDGATTSAVATVPPPVTLEVIEPDTTVGGAIAPVFVRGNPPALPRIDVEYIVVGFREGGSDPIFKPALFDYAEKASPREGGWEIEINLANDYLEIFRAFDQDNNVTAAIIDLRAINVTVHVGDSTWVSPTGTFDPEALVEPGTFSNVKNGFGFFGSGYKEAITFRPSIALLRKAGFHIPGDE